MGHVYEYNLSLKKAVELNGWSYSAWIPQDCQIEVPQKWEKILPSAQSFSFLKVFFSHRSALKKADPQPVLFLEHFRFSQLLALFFALLFYNRSSQLWLLHRYSPSQMKCKGKLHCYLYRALERLSGKTKLRFMTDSELLARQQEILFSRKIHILPIPHAQVTTQEKFPKPADLIYCWWPGGDTRESKGLKLICTISKLLKSQNIPLRLIVAKNAIQKGVIPSSSIILVEDEMDRKTYEKWLNTIDIALLPYDPTVYHSGSSGIFAEVISAGKLPIIRDETWMAYEARKYDLEKLILNWKSPFLLEQLVSISQDRTIRKRVEAMQHVYQQYHSIKGFAKSLQKLFPNALEKKSEVR